MGRCPSKLRVHGKRRVPGNDLPCIFAHSKDTKARRVDGPFLVKSVCFRAGSRRSPLRLDECEQIGVDLVFTRVGQTVRTARVDL